MLLFKENITHAPTTLFALVITVAMLPVGATAAEKLYKWTDSEGNVQYTQTPPTDAEAEEMAIEVSPPQGAGETEESGTSTAPDEAGGIPEGAGQDPELVEQRKRNCETARNNLRIFKEAPRLMQPDGSSIVISDEMREAKIREAEEQIERFCK